MPENTVETCGAPHPDPDKSLVCEKPRPCRGYHWAAGKSFPSDVPMSNPRRGKAGGALPPKGITQPEVTGPPDPKNPYGTTAVIDTPGVEGDPEEVIAVWVKQAIETLYLYLTTSRARFTTAEHVWPLLLDPPQVVADPRKRMRLVVDHAVRAGWMREVDSIRLRDTYRTRDGVEFKMNKIVPVYETCLTQRIEPTEPDWDWD